MFLQNATKVAQGTGGYLVVGFAFHDRNSWHGVATSPEHQFCMPRGPLSHLTNNRLAEFFSNVDQNMIQNVALPTAQ